MKKGGKEAAGACVSLSLRDFFGKKKNPEKQKPPPLHELWSRRENKQNHILNLIVDGVRWSRGNFWDRQTDITFCLNGV